MNAKVDRPVFITALPRSGTSILLEVLNTLPRVATNTYRDMPFIFSPVLWSKLSVLFQRTSDKKERAHGDGLFINEDSPEGFEEALWLKFFPQKYSAKRIYLWKEPDENFSAFFVSYMKSIIYLKLKATIEKGRYLSKNNANLARIPVLQTLFPACTILVPLRDPIEQASSMYQQHLNFAEQHRNKNFVKKYMADIGHFEFGELHRPIEFPDFEKLTRDLSPDNCDYWLAYCLSALRYLESCEGLTLFSYAEFCKHPVQSLTKLCQKMGLEASVEEIQRAVVQVKDSSERKHELKFSPSLREDAQASYMKLLEKAV